jgi:hypothetical protein
MKLLIQIQKQNKTYSFEKEMVSSTQMIMEAPAIINEIDRVAMGLKRQNTDIGEITVV